MPAPLDLTSLASYRRSCLEIARQRLAGFTSLAEVAAAESALNAYPHLEHLRPPREIQILDQAGSSSSDLDHARLAILDGGIFWEHAAAGEATRLKLGPKYLIDPRRDLAPIEKIAARIESENGEPLSIGEVKSRLAVDPELLLPLSLGFRHLLQLAFEVTRLAEESGLDPSEALNRQRLLLILNENSAQEIISQLRAGNMAGFARQNFFFMIQPNFPGINLVEGRFSYDPESPARLHNHGQLVMQETMDGQIFHLNESGRPIYLDSSGVARILETAVNKVSYNIEDLNYLGTAIDLAALALGLRLGDQGYRMVMEIVANNPDRPIKGGLAAFDEVLGRNVMVESFQLMNLAATEIRFLNKNFNQYPFPVFSWQAMRENGLPMPISVQDNRLYFKPVQGDINFLVKTAFIQRQDLVPILAWKTMADTFAAVFAMWTQDGQPGFKDFVSRVLE